jgi:hypothetical protein
MAKGEPSRGWLRWGTGMQNPGKQVTHIPETGPMAFYFRDGKLYEHKEYYDSYGEAMASK